ncbi:hypothetical protein D3Z50_09470 [Clostridiaceae bacterium]|nr:hypothetical protein [Clostridiaceae bacterium]
MIFELKEFLRNNKVTSELYMRLRTVRHKGKFVTYDEDRVRPIADGSESIRLNLIVPCFTKSFVYGGIATALKIFKEIQSELNCNGRIIVTGIEKYNKHLTYEFDGYSHNADRDGICFLTERTEMNVCKNDFFICTSWITAFYFYPVLHWQKKQFGIAGRKIVYLIQDFEPGFVPWSTEYVLAEQTYRHSEDTIAIFNSKELSEYFHISGYKYFIEKTFSPALNESMKKVLVSGMNKKREKRILIYGRPVSDRNAFGLIYEALKEWSDTYVNAGEWQIVSLGDKFDDIRLSNNRIVFKGKLSLEKYGEMLLSSYAGISLMISPHPSYPPLEMSVFGVRTITNSFATKDLSGFCENMISLDNPVPKAICKKLTEICEEYQTHVPRIIRDGEYISGGGMDGMCRSVAAELLKLA